MSKCVRMTITTTFVLSAPVGPNEQHLTKLSTADKNKIREQVTNNVRQDAAKNGTVVKDVQISGIYLTETP